MDELKGALKDAGQVAVDEVKDAAAAAAEEVKQATIAARKEAERAAKESARVAKEVALELKDDVMTHLKIILSYLQVSSLLSATYTVPWPPMFGGMCDIFGAVNIDIEAIKQPFTDLFAFFGTQMKEFACNATDMGFLSMFLLHWMVLPIIAALLTLAYGASLCLQKHKPDKYGGEAFSPARPAACRLSPLLPSLFLPFLPAPPQLVGSRNAGLSSPPSHAPTRLRRPRRPRRAGTARSASRRRTLRASSSR